VVTVNAGMDVAKAAPVPGTSRVMQILKAGGRTGRNCAAYATPHHVVCCAGSNLIDDSARFFTVYHTLLCTMRYFELNKKYDYVNVVAATAIPAVPLIMKARPDMAVCGMLVVLDNFTARQMVDAISGNREEDDDDEYEYVEVDDDEDY